MCLGWRAEGLLLLASYVLNCFPPTANYDSDADDAEEAASGDESHSGGYWVIQVITAGTENESILSSKELGGAETIVGRDAAAALRVEGRTISRAHACECKG